MAPTSTAAPTMASDLSCSSIVDCANMTGTICDSSGTCQCPDHIPVYVPDPSSCVMEVELTKPCLYDEQCTKSDQFGRCGTDKMCTCIEGYEVKIHKNVGTSCAMYAQAVSPVDPAMIGVLAGLALMFVIICVVLRLFAKARFKESRSIFNTPNPRLMNASLFKDSKLLSPSRGDRRGSRASVRAPSRAGSIASVNAATCKSPNGSLAHKGRRGSTISTASATGVAAAGAGRGGSPGGEHHKRGRSPSKDSTVAIETVD